MNIIIIKKLIKGNGLTKREIYNWLYEICDDVHGSCGSECPVYEINGGPVNPCRENLGCACFKDGKAMYEFLKRGIK